MSKRLSLFILILSGLGLLLAGAQYIKETGLLRKYPAAQYFSEEEERLRPAYAQLSKKEKAVYHALYEGISQKKEKIALPSEISGDTYSKLYCLVEKQESELFYAASTYYTAEKLRDAKIVYREGDVPYTEKEAEFRAAKAVALKSVSFNEGDYAKALGIHDYLIANCKYTDSDDTYIPTAYGCLVEKKANCEGYAKAFRLLASECGLPCVLVTGLTDTGENHAWNQVMIDGEWRNIDVTWDDSDVSGDRRRLYFLCSDEEFLRTHTPDNYGFKAFACGGESNDYYVRSGKVADDLASAENMICRAVQDGQTIIEVKFKTDGLYDQFKSIYIDGNRLFDVLMLEGVGLHGEVAVSVREDKEERCITLMLS
ncbi:MAG: hypothetical protein IKO47_13535 [Ruminococcus sp.]|nr:hypothetical protein [Ruminococcus sp.]